MISSAAHLKTVILALEEKKIRQEEALRSHFNKTYQSLRPVNIIKNTLHGITSDAAVRNNLLTASAGIGAVLATRKLLINKLSGSIFKKILAGIIELGAGKAAVTGTHLLKDKGLQLLSSLLKKKKQPVQHS
jgi:hypothetical protein